MDNSGQRLGRTVDGDQYDREDMHATDSSTTQPAKGLRMVMASSVIVMRWFLVIWLLNGDVTVQGFPTAQECYRAEKAVIAAARPAIKSTSCRSGYE